MLYPATPFQSIGLSLSGGGFRAATFGLGVLSLLNELKVMQPDGSEKPMLENVHFVSSASGGTITLIVYAACKSAGMKFDEFYQYLMPKLTGQKLLDQVFTILDDDSQWPSQYKNGKDRNLINAFSIAYQQQLFTDIPNTLGTLRHPYNPSHIKEVCFNASEFSTGLSFRFQCHQTPGNTQARGGLFGNENMVPTGESPWASLDTLRLADILASSSCFPGGFEPMRYPQDFTYSQGASLQALQEALKIDSNIGKQEGPLVLMDGGICDNQGLDSLLNAFDRHSLLSDRTDTTGAFDLLLVNDVASHYMLPTQFKDFQLSEKFASQTPNEGWFKINKRWNSISYYLKIALFITSALLIISLLLLWDEGSKGSTILLTILSIVFAGTLLWIQSKWSTLKQHMGNIARVLDQSNISNAYSTLLPKQGFGIQLGGKLLDYIGKRPWRETSRWVSNRYASGATLVGDIFLKQIRRQIYHKLFSDVTTYYRRVYNPIFALSRTNDSDRKRPPFDIQGSTPDEEYEKERKAFRDEHDLKNKFTPVMQDAADLAFKMGTTLWFSPTDESSNSTENVRRALIATGQFTTTYQLYQYTLLLKTSRHYKTLTMHYKNVVESLLLQLENKMKKFRIDPYCMVK